MRTVVRVHIFCVCICRGAEISSNINSTSRWIREERRKGHNFGCLPKRETKSLYFVEFSGG